MLVAFIIFSQMLQNTPQRNWAQLSAVQGFLANFYRFCHIPTFSSRIGLLTFVVLSISPGSMGSGQQETQLQFCVCQSLQFFYFVWVWSSSKLRQSLIRQRFQSFFFFTSYVLSSTCVHKKCYLTTCFSYGQVKGVELLKKNNSVTPILLLSTELNRFHISINFLSVTNSFKGLKLPSIFFSHLKHVKFSVYQLSFSLCYGNLCS